MGSVVCSGLRGRGVRKDAGSVKVGSGMFLCYLCLLFEKKKSLLNLCFKVLMQWQDLGNIRNVAVFHTPGRKTNPGEAGAPETSSPVERGLDSGRVSPELNLGICITRV